MVNGCRTHLVPIPKRIIASLCRAVIHKDVRTRLPSRRGRSIPEPDAPKDGILRLKLVEDLEKGFFCLRILLRRPCFARSRHRHLQIVEECDGIPDLQPQRLISHLTDKGTLKLHERSHPVLAFARLIEIFADAFLRKISACPACAAVATVCTSLVAIMAFAHD